MTTEREQQLERALRDLVKAHDAAEDRPGVVELEIDLDDARIYARAVLRND